MISSVRLFAIVATCLGAVSASAQSGITLRKCDEPKTPIGMLPKGYGSIAYQLGKDGKPDTASIAVLKVIGLSAPAFHSVAARELSACRFDVGKPEPGKSVLVVSDVTFSDSAHVEIGTTSATPDSGTPMSLDASPLPKESLPLAVDDRRIEERPRRLSCKAPQGPRMTSVTGRGSSQAAAQADARSQIEQQMDQWNQTHGGVLVAEILVGADGKPGSQVRVISVSNPMAAQNLAEIIGGCRFAPGRVNGVAVPVYMVTRVP